MGGLVSLATLVLEDPTTILANNSELEIGSSWSTYIAIDPFIANTLSFDQYSIVGYPGVTSPYAAPYYIVRPLVGTQFASLGIVTPTLNNFGNSKVTALSVVENITPGSETIDFFLRSVYLDYEYEGSITPYGILTTSFAHNLSVNLLVSFPGYFIRPTIPPTVAGITQTITYAMMNNTLINRSPGAISNDTLDTVANIIADSGFLMASETSNSTFRFFIKNLDKSNAITLLPGVGWTFIGGVSFSIPAITCAAFYASIDYNAGTGDLMVLSRTIAAPP